MTPEYFESLNDEEREDILTEAGTHLACREYNGCTFHLYQVESFYIEFCYQISKSSTVTTSIFTDMDKLEPYLIAIDININDFSANY